MILPVDFHFSQGSLRDFLVCPRRFQLRYIERMAWPAVEAEPYLEREVHLKRGAFFHRLAEQILKGVPAEALDPLAETSGLSEWWASFIEFRKKLPEGIWQAETTRTTRLGSHTLLAKYDLLIHTPDGKLAIFDWKTSSIRVKSTILHEDIQTRLYLLLAAETILGVQPEAITMTYWFAAFPSQPECIHYSAAQHQRDRADILELIDQITHAPPESFILTSDERACRFCIYRSYCDRGVDAGITGDMDDDMLDERDPDSFDFNQAAEVAF